MLRFILYRLALIIPTFIGVTIIAFFFIRLLPGDPVPVLAGERGVSPERHAEVMAQLGFDRPLWEQYLNYLGNVLPAISAPRSPPSARCSTEFFTLFPATVELSLCAIILAIVIGIPAGIFAAVKRGSWFDQLTMGTALVGYSMPIFWWGLLLIIFFSGYLGWTPVSGRIALSYFFQPVTGFMLIDSLLSGQKGAFLSALHHLILPTIVLATIPLAVIARQTRSAMLEVLGEDYVRTARAKGLPPRRVIGLHALRNALIPVVTTIGLQVGVLLAGAILTETIFSWPGIGKWMIDSIVKRDYFVVQSGLLLIALIIMAVNLIVDVLYALINPRIRHAVSARGMTTASPSPPAAAGRRRGSPGLREFWYYFSQNTRRRHRPRRLRRCSSLVAIFAPCSRRTIRPTSIATRFLTPPVWQEGGDPQVPPRHRRGRPRHPLAPDLRRALFAAHRRRRRHHRAHRRHHPRPARRLFPRLGRRADHARHGHHPGLPLAAAGAGAGRRSSAPACSTPCSPSRWSCSRISRA